MTIRVFGRTTVTVTTTIEVDDDISLSEKAIYKMAKERFKGIDSYGGNGGVDKLIGVEGKNDTICADEDVEWDDYEKGDDHNGVNS